MSSTAASRSAGRAALSFEGSAHCLHASLERALADLRRAEKNAVLLFAEILERKLYRELGYSSIHLYAAKALNFSKSKTSQFIRLAGSLKTLPELKRSVSTGELSWTKAREVTRVATPDTEGAWVRTAKDSTRKDLESKIALAKSNARRVRRANRSQLELSEWTEPASQDPVPSAPAAVSFQLDSIQLAKFDALMERLRKLGRRESKAELLLTALSLLIDEVPDPHEETSETEAEKKPEKFTRVNSSPYQIVIYKCSGCDKSKLVTNRGERNLATGELDRIACDAKVLEPGKRNRSTIPPSTRRTVLARDGHRCRTPGCGATRFLEVHHIRPRSAGGGNKAENLITLCSACHRLHHEGMSPSLRNAGSPPG